MKYKKIAKIFAKTLIQEILEKAREKRTRALNFVKYHNAFTIGLLLVFVVTAGAFAANEDARDVVFGEEIITETGIDNSQLLSADLDNFDVGLTIDNVLEDEKNYYINYSFNIIAIQDNVWQPLVKSKKFTVNKQGLGNRDLGLYLIEEFSEVARGKLSYLEKAQKTEKEKGKTKIIKTVKYTGLIGLVFDDEEKDLFGYEPVVVPQESVAAEQVASAVPALPASIYGCMDSTALNYSADATQDDGSCEYPPASAPAQVVKPPIVSDAPDVSDIAAGDEDVCGADNIGLCDTQALCEGEELYWYNEICNLEPEVISGCADETATNYNAEATQDDGSCEYPPAVCESFTYSEWGECRADGTQTSSVLTSSPDGCVDGNPIITQTCEYIDTSGDGDSSEPVCDLEHLNLCLTESDCLGVSGFWYNEVCNSVIAPTCGADSLGLCDTQEKCAGIELYWYAEKCNLEEEVIVCIPEWSCPDWAPLPETIACGQEFPQTRTCSDSNNCGSDEGKSTEEQGAVGTCADACPASSCDAGLNLTGECANTCVEGACSNCVPDCVCADGFSDCDSDLTSSPTNGCETSGACETIDNG